MKRLHLATEFDLPVDAVTQAIGILAKRRAGKSYLARRLAEQLFKAGQQIVIVDPKGDWWGIRSSADGKSPGLPVVILGGERGDVPLEVNAGEIVAKLVTEERVSVLLDLSLFRKHEVTTFMTAFLEISAIEVLPEIPTREGNPQTPDELRALMKKLVPHHARIAWGMAVGGMGPKEFWGKWKTLSDRVRIFGTKREGRNRFVPIVDRFIERPTVEYRAFQKALAKATDGAIEPYDMRRSFATWMEEAGIPRTRRKMYMGHGPADVTDLYERRQIEQFLAEDSEKLRKHVYGDAVTATEQGLHLMKEGAS